MYMYLELTMQARNHHQYPNIPLQIETILKYQMSNLTPIDEMENIEYWDILLIFDRWVPPFGSTQVTSNTQV